MQYSNYFKLMLFFVLTCFSLLILISGCDSSDHQGNEDGDLDTETSNENEDGDLDADDNEKASETTDQNSEEDELEYTEQEEPEIDTTDGDTDGELAEIIEDESEIVENEVSESVEDETSEVDAELSEEAELEEYTEVEQEEVITCSSDDDPFDFLEIIDEPYFESSEYFYEGKIENQCSAHGFIFAGAKGMKVAISVNPNSFSTPLHGRMIVSNIAAVSKRRDPVVYFDNTDNFPLSGFDYTITLPYSGEYLVLVSGKDLSSTGDYSISATCIENCDTKYTRNPIVLMHGMAGFDSAFFNLVNYFQGVEEDLTNRGYNVHTTEVAMFNDSQYRATEVESQLIDILTTTGARKIDIIAHSQGGLDARYFISSMNHGGDVAVLAMLATPHKGSVVADVLLGNITGFSQDVIVALLDFFANLIDGSEADVKAALNFISRDYMTNTFNPQNPDDPRVKYWSWAGITCNLLATDCNNSLGHDRVGLELSITYGIIKNGSESEGFGPNDGMVQYKSAEYGEFMGYVSADHADEIGQFKSGDFDHKQFYRNVSALMFDRGF